MRRISICTATLLVLAGINSASATTCSQMAANCRGSAGAGKPQIVGDCELAKQSCLKTGTFVGPSTGKSWSGLKKE
jgi:hypothetical protein